MRKEITWIRPLRAGLVAALASAAIYLVFGIFAIVFVIMGRGPETAPADPVSGVFAIFFGIITGGIFGFVSGAVSAFLYNVVTEYTGGIVIELSDEPISGV